MSDSGGFQVFSLASPKRQSTAKAGLANYDNARHHVFSTASPRLWLGPRRLSQKQVSSLSSLTRKADIRGEEQPLLVKISEDGVKFRSTFDGTLVEFTPEKSMEYQAAIGADINMAFDECMPYGSNYEYSKKATERTHHWLLRSIGQYQISRLRQDYGGQAKIKNQNENSKLKNEKLMKNEKFKMKNNQYLYGVIQGGTFEDLRRKSAEFVVSQNTPGVAIGGVSVGESKAEMRDQVRWVSEYLPKDRPVHLLGVGQIDDIIDLVKYGVDTFDCVEPTRLARMGQIYKARHRKFFDGKQQTAKNLVSSLSGQTDITKNIYKNNLESLDEDCNCYVCKNFTKSYLHHLFKQREILGYTLATYHNLWVMEKLFEKIREIVKNNLI